MLRSKRQGLMELLNAAVLYLFIFSSFDKGGKTTIFPCWDPQIVCVLQIKGYAREYCHSLSTPWKKTWNEDSDINARLLQENTFCV